MKNSIIVGLLLGVTGALSASAAHSAGPRTRYWVPEHRHCHTHVKKGFRHCHKHTHGGEGKGHHGRRFMHHIHMPFFDYYYHHDHDDSFAYPHYHY